MATNGVNGATQQTQGVDPNQVEAENNRNLAQQQQMNQINNRFQAAMGMLQQEKSMNDVRHSAASAMIKSTEDSIKAIIQSLK